jgi:ribosomal-protein-alanine N-acetyltransferase
MNDRMGPEIIKTERLVLQPWSFDDLADVLSYAADDEWGRCLPVPRPYGEADARRFVATQILLDRKQHPSWSIRCDGHGVGGINIRFSSESRIGELGYSIARAWWGRGLAAEAARAVIGQAFDAYPDLVRVRAMADARNVRSHRVLEKVGMVREGLLRQNRLVRGELVDEIWFGVLRTEWDATTQRRPVTTEV